MNNQPTVICPKCGNVEPAGNTFCSKCGTPIAPPQPQPQQPPVYNQPPQPQYGAYVPQAAPMDKKKLAFFGGIGGAGLFGFCRLVSSIVVMSASGYLTNGTVYYLFELFGSLGLATAIASAFLYMKEKFDEK